jgi:hypothetical protein
MLRYSRLSYAGLQLVREVRTNSINMLKNNYAYIRFENGDHQAP